MRSVYLISTMTLWLLLVVFPSCHQQDSSNKTQGASTTATQAVVEIQGAGATFPYPLYSKWISAYEHVDPQVRINYQSIGSGGGIRQIGANTVDFGASDAPMTDAELQQAPKTLLHIPTTIGAVVVAYNYGENNKLKLSGEVIAGLFLGEITKWNDPKLQALNPDVKLSDMPITIVHRSDGSGTTAIFTEYLASVSQTWKDKVGSGKSVQFPTGLGAKGNEGIAGQLKTSPNSVGYVELAYAMQTGIAYATIKNRAGQFVEPSLASMTAAAASVTADLPEDLRMSIVDSAGTDAYPIAAFTYILVYQNQLDTNKASALTRFLWWAVHEGQRHGPALHYANLPVALVTKIEDKLRHIRVGDKPILDVH